MLEEALASTRRTAEEATALARRSGSPFQVAVAVSNLVSALLAAAQLDEALPLLADAPARPDGMHLFAHALAALQSRSKDGPEVARARFQALQRDYPSSSLARNAGRFANQLAPR